MGETVLESETETQELKSDNHISDASHILSVILTTPTSSSSESERLVGDELRRDAAASFEFNFSTPSACGRSTSCNSDVDVDIFWG